MKNTLFDEKIDGTVHLAIGAGIPSVGGHEPLGRALGHGQGPPRPGPDRLRRPGRARSRPLDHLMSGSRFALAMTTSDGQERWAERSLPFYAVPRSKLRDVSGAVSLVRTGRVRWCRRLHPRSDPGLAARRARRRGRRLRTTPRRRSVPADPSGLSSPLSSSIRCCVTLRPRSSISSSPFSSSGSISIPPPCESLEVRACGEGFPRGALGYACLMEPLVDGWGREIKSAARVS